MKAKKNKKFFFLHWYFLRSGIILSILCAGFCCDFTLLQGADARTARLEKELERTRKELSERENELKKLRSENEFLRNENAVQRRELIETLDKYSTQAGHLKRLEQGVAGTIESLEPVYTGAREMVLASDLQQCLIQMRKLSAEVLNFTDETGKKLPEIMTDNVEIARMRLRLDALRNEAVSAARMTEAPGAPVRFVSCRILELNREWKLAILAGGIRNGIRNGMLLTSGKVRLKVVAVRNFVSAAAVISGSFDELAVGHTAAVGSGGK